MSSNYNRPNQGRVPGYKPTPAHDSAGRPLLDDLLDDPSLDLSDEDLGVPPPPPPVPGYNPSIVAHTQATINRPLSSFDLPENLSDLGLTTRTPAQAKAQRFQTPEGRQFVTRNGAATTETGRKTKPVEGEIVDFQFDTEPSRYISNAPETVADALREKRPYTYSDTPENRTRVIGTPNFEVPQDEEEELDVPPPPPVDPAHLVNEPTYDATKRRSRQRTGRRGRLVIFRNPVVALVGGIIAAMIVVLLVALLFFLGRSIDRTTTDKFSVLFASYGDGLGYGMLGDGPVWAKSFSNNFLTKSTILNADVRLDSSIIKDAKTASSEAQRTTSDVVVWGYYDAASKKLYTTLTIAPNGPFDPPVGRGRQVTVRSLFDPEQLTFVTTPPTDNATDRLPLVDLIYAISSYYSGNYDVALATVTRLLNQAVPENEAGLRFLRANIQIGYGHNPQAIEDYDRVIALNQAALNQNKPTLVPPIWVYNNRGFAYNLLGKYNEAVDSYKRAFGFPEEVLRSNREISKRLSTPGQGNPLVKVYVNYAQATLDQGQGAISPIDLADWQTGLIEALKLEPNDSFAYHYLGLTYRYQNNYDQAIASQIKARDLDDNYLEAHNELGIIYLLKDEREPKPETLNAAADAFRRGEARADAITTQNRQTRQTLASQGNQTLASIWDVRIAESETLLNRMRLGIARTFFEQARRITGKDLGNPFDRLLRWVKGQKTPFEEAGPRLKQMVETMPEYPDANFYYGQYLDFSGEGDPLPYYKKAKDLEPKLALKFQYYDTLATQYATAGKKDEALKEYNDFIALDKSRAQGYAARAILQLQFGMIPDAIASANEAIRLAPQDAYSHYVAGQAQIQNRQYAVAINYLDRAITLNPTLTDAYLQRGIALFDLNRRSEALDAFNKTINLDEYQTQAYYFAGIIYQENAANPQKAQEMWEKAVSINPGYASAWVKLGILYSQLNQIDKAINAYNKALASNEQDATTHYYLGLLYEVKNNWPEAEKQYRRAVELNPGLVNARYKLADAIEHNGGKSEDALNAAQDAVKLAPNSADAQFTLAELRLSRNEFDQAIPAYDAAIKLRPDYAEAYYGKARALYGKQQLDPALDSINQAIKLRPKWGQAIFLQGSILTDKGQLDEATKSFDQARPLLDANDPALLAAVGALNERKGDVDNAIKSYEASLKGYEPQADIHFKLGSLYFQRRNFDQALAHFSRVRQLNDKWPQIDYWLGRTYEFLGRNDEAAASLENMIKIQPNFVEAHYELGNVYHVKGQFPQSQDQYDQALKLQPEFYQAWLSKGKIYEEQVNVPDAIKAYQMAAKSTDPQIKQVVADSLRRLGAR